MKDQAIKDKVVNPRRQLHRANNVPVAFYVHSEHSTAMQICPESLDRSEGLAGSADKVDSGGQRCRIRVKASSLPDLDELAEGAEAVILRL